MELAAAADWLTHWADTWNLPDLPQKLIIETGPRLRRSLGRCQPGTGLVRLHPALLDLPESDPTNNDRHEALLKEVLCHEAAHVAVHLLHGGSVRPHGQEWACLMRVAGYVPRVRIDPATLPSGFRRASQPTVLYQHRCPICGAGRIARRPVRQWRCRACHEAGLEGRLEILTRPLVARDSR